MIDHVFISFSAHLQHLLCCQEYLPDRAVYQTDNIQFFFITDLHQKGTCFYHAIRYVNDYPVDSVFPFFNNQGLISNHAIENFSWTRYP